MLLLRVCSILSGFLLVQGIFQGNMFNINRAPFIVYGELYLLEVKLVFAGTILRGKKTLYLSTRDVGASG